MTKVEMPVVALASGISSWSLIGVVAVIFRAAGVIGWPWVWVTAPLWAPWVFVILIIILIAVVDDDTDPYSPPLYAKDITWS